MPLETTLGIAGSSVWALLRDIGVVALIPTVEDPALVRYLADKQIPVEICITSNIKTGCCLALKDHPVRKLFDAGVPIVLNTDDPDMFHTDLISEYRIARDVFHFNEAELRELARNSVRASFLSDGRKQELLASF